MGCCGCLCEAVAVGGCGRGRLLWLLWLWLKRLEEAGGQVDPEASHLKSKESLGHTGPTIGPQVVVC